MINNRQNGRRRGRNGNAPRPNGGGGQPDRGSRLDNRARGNASQLHEKYKTLAADMQRQGDRVMTEYYLQFADHYFRVLSETRARFEDQQPRRDRFEAQSDDFDEADGGDGEGYEERAPERGQRAQEWDRGDEGQRVRQDRDGNRGDGREAGRGEANRGDGGRGEGMRGLEGPRSDAGRDRPERGDERGQREPRPPRDGFEQRQRPRRGERQDGERQPVAAFEERAPEPASSPVEPVAAAPVEAAPPLDAPVPERRPRGRPRKVVEPIADDGERIEMDRLPPALSDASAEGDAPAEPKPRRVRRPRGETAAA